ncbi:hypothetical protein GCM10027442_09020 [Emticicia fontis]
MSEGVQILSVFGQFYFTQTPQTADYQQFNFNGITLVNTYATYKNENQLRNSILTHRTNQFNQNDSIKKFI